MPANTTRYIDERVGACNIKRELGSEAIQDGSERCHSGISLIFVFIACTKLMLATYG